MNLLVFPNQLFADHPGLELKPERVVLVEDSLFFGDAHHPVNFHKQKLWLHRASMKRYERCLQAKGFETVYFDCCARPNSLKRHLMDVRRKITSTSKEFVVAAPTDFLLEKRLARVARQLDFEIQFLPTPGFINQSGENREYRNNRKRWFMADFYKYQRKRLNILVNDDEPVGGKWSFDEDNRKKIPKKIVGTIPGLMEIERDEIDMEAIGYVQKKFPDNIGNLEHCYYPTDHVTAGRWLEHFLKNRLELFGPYEDAILQNESWLWHSVLTPSLNIGLLTPDQVVASTLEYAQRNEVSLNSLEGFIRQIIGWREFMRATYEDHGVEMRTTNHWNHHRKIPNCFYDGTTGILPIDDTIRRILKTGYCHHIERLMVLGGFMFLCEFDPNEIYRWFMEMFVDSYDWVMVPNVYSMSQHSDGGLITTKPYFSGSSYIRKMSHYKDGPWCKVWDGLYWRWIWNHVDELGRNPRWSMMCAMVKKMDSTKRQSHIDVATGYLDGLN